MKPSEFKSAIEGGKAQVLTLERAKALKGKAILWTYFGYESSAQFVEKKSLQYSHKKVGRFDEHGNRTDDVVVTHHQPQLMSPVNNVIHEL